MKIAIIGFSGSGKSTLAKKLGCLYDIPVLHLDTIHFMGSFEIRERCEMKALLDDFLNQNENWVIDGSYLKIDRRRFLEADMVIYLSYNRFVCLKNVIFRHCKNRNKVREDLGCLERLDLSFLWWVFQQGRTRGKKKALKECAYSAKRGLIFKTRRSLNKYLKKLEVEQNEASSKS